MNFLLRIQIENTKKKKKNWVGAGGWSKCIFSYGFKFEIKKNLFFGGGARGRVPGTGGGAEGEGG